MPHRQTLAGFVLCTLVLGSVAARADETPAKISYYRQIRPIFQANCQGCHQPAKPKGSYVMTSFDRLLKGGDSEAPAVVPGEPDESNLVDLITPIDGKADMPEGQSPLSAAEIALVRRWIAEGAVDDTPEGAKQRYDKDHPPIYTRPPVITSLDYSPDGKLLAVAGFHEVVLVHADGSGQAARLIGMSERIESVRFSPDGSRLAATGGLPGRMGEVQVWDVAKRELTLSLPATFDTVYGGSWSPDGKQIAFGCADNTVRAISAASGKQLLSMAAHQDWVRGTVFSGDGESIFSASRDMTVKMTDVATQRFVGNLTTHTPGVLRGGMIAIDRHPKRNEVLVGGADGAPKLFKMDVQAAPAGGGNPNQIREYEALRGRVFDVRFSPDGSRFFAASSLDGKGEVRAYETDSGKRLWSREIPEGGLYALAISPDGATLATAGADGQIRLLDAAGGEVRQAFLPVEIAGADVAEKPDFIRDVNPILSRLGCNTGTCHGSANGRNGFKLSLRGYDPLFDVRSLTDDLAARRVSVAAPDRSLMLLKATAAVPHEGGQRVKPEHPYYQVLRQWIAAGATLDLGTPRVAKIDVLPKNPVLEKPGDTQPVQVVATYADGATRDVTREAFLESGNTEVATAGDQGVMTAVRRGEAAVLARYEGAYAATTLTVMGDRSGFTWQEPETWNRIDELVAAKWKRLKISPSGLASDAEFLRRVWLDLTGLPPTADQVRAFLADSRDPRTKRDELIERLIGSPEYLEHWTNKWADLLQVNRKYLGPEGAASLRQWIRAELAANTPYDQFARKILTASGSNRENPAASYYKVLREPLETMENTTHLFLGVRFNCNKCHDHPFERWTQDQYYQTAAYFARFELKPDPASGDQKIGGTAVEGAKPLYEIVADKPQGEVVHDRTRQVAAPKFPFDCQYEAPQDAPRRQELAAWLTSPDNPYFARSYVNRLWGYLLGVGLIEPLDDIRAGNPPSNPELLDYLTQEFRQSGFDVRHVIRLICRSRTYQLSLETNAWNADDSTNYSHALARRLPAEVLYDALHRVTGSVSRIPGVAAGIRAAELPDVGVEMSDGFLANLGRPARESACECERSHDLQLGPVMAMVSGPTVEEAVSDPKSELARLAASPIEPAVLVEEVFLRVLNRPAKPEEVQAGLSVLEAMPQDHQQLAARLQEHEQKLAPAIAAKEKARQEAIGQAQAALSAHEQEIAPRQAELEKQRQERIVQAQAALADYEKGFADRLAAWEAKAGQTRTWIPLDPTELSATNGAQLARQDDLSVLASGPNGKGSYKLVARTDLPGITGVKLEALADERLPSKGPGRSPNGNFVLTEFRVEWAPQSKPEQKSPVVLQNAQADFSQANYDVKTAIDGQKAPQNNGWATHPKTGENRTAVFETQQDLGAEPGLLTVWLDQEYADAQHALGRFRVSVTTGARPVTLDGLPPAIVAILAVAADKRSDAQKAELDKFYRGLDGELKQRQQALAEAQKPQPIDPKLQQLRERLAAASQPLPVDPHLAELRRAVELSQKQLANARLTFVQDLTWALVNTPAFLFNR